MIDIINDYSNKIFNPVTRKKLVSKIKKYIKTNKIDAVAAIGQSGLILGSIVTHQMKNVGLISIRKPKETEHDQNMINSYCEDKNIYDKWIFVDDLIATGETFSRVIVSISIHNTLRKINDGGNGFVKSVLPHSILLYNDYQFDEHKKMHSSKVRFFKNDLYKMADSIHALAKLKHSIKWNLKDGLERWMPNSFKYIVSTKDLEKIASDLENISEHDIERIIINSI